MRNHEHPTAAHLAATTIGAAEPRPAARTLVAGRGCYVDDISLPNMAHVAFLRSPVAFARITAIDLSQARAAPGVIAAYTGADLKPHCQPWAGVVKSLPGMKAPLQYPLAVETVRWQGEAVAAVVADSRAEAEDAVRLITVAYEEQSPILDAEAALAPGAAVISPELGDNRSWLIRIDSGDTTAAMADAAVVVEDSIVIDRHTSASLEPRSIIAAYDKAAARLTLYHSTQIPHAIRHIFAKHLGLREQDVRVLHTHVGGSFGLKGNAFPDEFATAVISTLLDRPVKFIADRGEAFLADGHCRDHRVHMRLGLTRDGLFTAMEVEDYSAIGPYSVYPKSGAIETLLTCAFAGVPYRIPNVRANGHAVFVNKAVVSQIRGVGIPVACTVTESMVDLAAQKIGMDPFEIRRRNLHPDDGYPVTTPFGFELNNLSQQAALERLRVLMDYDALRRQQADLRARKVWRGIGIASFIEGTAPGPALYGAGDVPISAQDSVTVRLEPSGDLTCLAGISEQGQGGETAIMQIVAATLSLPLDRIRILTGDTTATPYGGGTWASRSTSIAGEAALRAASLLKTQLLNAFARTVQADPAAFDLRNGHVIERATGAQRMTLEELGHLLHFKQHQLPPDIGLAAEATAQHSLQGGLFLFNNGVIGCHAEVDCDTGAIRLLGVWGVSDCGRIVNRLLVEEQLRGGIVQGIGAALYEQLLYDETGKLGNGSFRDYLLPNAADIPDIRLEHIETPTTLTRLGAKGTAEAGIIGAAAAVMNAVNDALRPHGARVSHQPFTPERILRALGRI